METRILHCGKNLDNYYLCLQEKIAGFTRKTPKKGDTIYLTVNVKGIYYCGAKFIIGEETDLYPWPIDDLTFFAFTMKNIEYCKPFRIDPLALYHDYWILKFIQGAKSINDKKALGFLDQNFTKNKTKELHRF